MEMFWHQRRAIGVCLALQGALMIACAALIGVDQRSAQPFLEAEGLLEPLHLLGGSNTDP
tara:strand:- start:2380 stop:2559 length:180 start_codon:yes stop_codon:yes gene_type:complete